MDKMLQSLSLQHFLLICFLRIFTRYPGSQGFLLIAQTPFRRLTRPQQLTAIIGIQPPRLHCGRAACYGSIIVPLAVTAAAGCRPAFASANRSVPMNVIASCLGLLLRGFTWENVYSVIKVPGNREELCSICLIKLYSDVPENFMT